MTDLELGRRLKNMYENAKTGEMVTMIYLFGIKYHSEIALAGVKDVINASGIKSTYSTELSKAIKLAKYVRPLS